MLLENLQKFYFSSCYSQISIKDFFKSLYLIMPCSGLQNCDPCMLKLTCFTFDLILSDYYTYDFSPQL